MNAANLHVLSNVTDAPQALLEPVTQVEHVCYSYTFESMKDKMNETKVLNVLLCEMTHIQEPLAVSNSLPSMVHLEDPSNCPLGAADTTDDSEEDDEEDSEMDDWEPREPQSFNPHSLCE